MTVTVAPTRNEYTATAGQTVFTYTFKIFEDTDLNVYVTPSGQEANDFTDNVTPSVVTGVGDEDGGTITIPATSLNDLVTIVSDIPASRTTDYQNNGDFRPPVVNADFDRVVSLAKQVEDVAGRSLVFPESQQNTQQLLLPAPVAGQLLRWNNLLTGLENVGVSTPVETTLSSVAALKALDISGLVNGTTIFLTGFRTDADGGGGPRKILLTGAPLGFYADIGAAVILPNGGDGSAAWVDNTQNTIFAADWGMNQNQSAEVNTQVILDFIEYAKGGAGYPTTLELPSGVIEINELDLSVLSASDALTIRGQGRNNSTSGTWLKIVSASTYSINTTGLKWLTIRDLGIDGNGLADEFLFKALEGKLINVWGLGHLKYDLHLDNIGATVDTCRFDNTLGDGTGAASLIEYNAHTIRDSVFNGQNNAPSMIIKEGASQTDAMSIRGCTFESGSPYELVLTGFTRSLNISGGNYFEGNFATLGTIHIAPGTRHTGLVIEGNRIGASGATAILIDEVDRGSSMSIKNNWGNRAIHLNLAGHTLLDGIRLEDMPIMELSNNDITRSDGTVILNETYSIETIYCSVTHDPSLGSPNAKKIIRIEGFYKAITDVATEDLFKISVSDGGGASYSQGLFIQAETRWREDASTVSNDLNFYRKAALFWNDGTNLNKIEQDLLLMEGSPTVSVDWFRSTPAVGEISLTGTGKSGLNSFFTDIDVKMYQ